MKKICDIQLEKIFKIIYLVHLLCAFNAIINQTAVIKITLGATMLAGAIVAFIKLKSCQSYFKYINFGALNAFIISYVISTIYNFKYGYMDNIQGLIWLGAQIWILYLINYDATIEDIKKEFAQISAIYVVWVTLSNIISLGMFFSGFSKRIIENEIVKKTYGFLWGRLWGIYDDPNHGSIIAMCAIVMAIYLWNIYKAKGIKFAIIISIIIQALYIIMSDSRTGILCIAVGVALIVSISVYWKKIKANILWAIMSFIITFGIILALEVPVQKTMGVIGTYTKEFLDSNDGLTEEEEEEVEVGRDELTSDPSNRRFDIWKSGIDLFKTSPILGIGRFNYVGYAKEEVPDAYIITNDLQKFDSMHNMPLDVLVSQGFLGILVLVWVVIQSVWKMVQNYKDISKDNYKIMLILFVLIAINAMSSMFISTVIYINSPATFVFWMCFGYFFRIIQLEKQR